MTPLKSTVRKQAAPGVSFERNTRQRRAITAAFEAAQRPLSIAEVVAAVNRDGGATSVPTAYRTVKALLDERWLEAIELPGVGPYYEVAGKEHHHHFVCVRCRAAHELPECTSPNVSLPRGFRALSHQTTVFGVCAACSSAR